MDQLTFFDGVELEDRRLCAKIPVGYEKARYYWRFVIYIF